MRSGKQARARAVSIAADRPYLQALDALARHKNTFVADLVRQAVDAKFGKELAKMQRIIIERDAALKKALDTDAETA